jgi:Uma2 family endonuclease
MVAVFRQGTQHAVVLGSWGHLPMRVRTAVPLSDDELFETCQLNRDLHIERTAEGELVIMPPTGGDTGRRNAIITARLLTWAERDGTGLAFDSSTGFILPNGAERSPDAAWIQRERWDALTAAQRSKFPPLCPDFVLELRSPSDGLAELQAKMEEYRENGARLGWLIDPDERCVHVYRVGSTVEVLRAPAALSGEPVLPGFTLDLAGLLPARE